MNKKFWNLTMLVGLALFVVACGSGGSSGGSAPRTPFIGGTSGLTIGFEDGSPPPEVTDDETFSFAALVRLQNDGETPVSMQNIKANLVGFDPSDFGRTFDDMINVEPEDDLEAKRRDSEGNIIDGTTTYATFPKGGAGNNFIPTKFTGNTEFTFRTDVCYLYQTLSNTKLCILKDMFNVKTDSLCKPTGTKQVYSSSAPVQIQNFRQSVVGQNKVSFTFDIVLSGNVDVFWSKEEVTPQSGFDAACPRAPRERRERENKVGIQILELPVDPVIVPGTFKCGGLDNGDKGVITLIKNRRTLTCTADIVENRIDLEKVVGVIATYNVLDNKEMKVLVKHLTT